MLKRLSLFITTALLSCAAFGQSAPGFTFGQTPTPGQWNSYFASKMDYNVNGLPISLGGTGATTVAQAQANLGLSPGGNLQPYSPILSQIAAGTWAGATSITTLGAITAGVWQGTPIGSNYGGAGAVMGALRGNGSGVVTQAACSDLSNATTACSTPIGAASGNLVTLTTGGVFSSSVMPALTGDVTKSVGSSATTVAAIDGHTVTVATSGTLVSTGDTGTVTSTMMMPTGVGAGSCTSCALTFDIAGRVLSASNTSSTSTLKRSTHTTAYTAAPIDQGSVLYGTGTWTLTLATPATLGNGWWAIVQSAGTGNITITPASGTIDGLSTYVMYPGEVRIINTDGTNFFSVVLNPFSLKLLSTTTITIPPGYQAFSGILWGGGGGGSSGTGAYPNMAGGGGGAAVPFNFASLGTAGATITCTVAGTAAAGTSGNSSTLGSLLTAYGGAYGGPGSGGGGGGALSPGSQNTGGAPGLSALGTDGQGMGGAGASGNSAWGGAGSSQSANPAGKSVYGGGGGGGSSGSGSTSAGGTSVFGGAGGAGASSGAAGAGMQPGGGGGGSYNGTGGTGAAGECSINGVI